jgi:hypothetical protein
MKAEGRKEGRVTILPVLNQGVGREEAGGKEKKKIRRNIGAEGGRDTETT